MEGSKIMEITRGRHLRIYRLITFLHAMPDGHAVLRGQTSWRTVNGVLINTRRGHLMILFRRMIRS